MALSVAMSFYHFPVLLPELGVLVRSRPPRDAPASAGPASRVRRGGDLMSIFTLFGGNRAKHARQSRLGNGHWIYRPVDEPLGEQVLEEHLAGRVTAGVYLLGLGDRVRALALDVDVTKSFLPSYLASEETRAAIDGLQVDRVRAVLTRAGTLGVRALVERSGQKGYHVWVFMHEAPAALARALGRALLAEVEPALEIHWEIFPRQDHAAGRGKGLGNLVKLPLGIHRSTGRRSTILDQQTFVDVTPEAALEVLRAWTPHAVSEIRHAVEACGDALPTSSFGAVSDHQPAPPATAGPLERAALPAWPDDVPSTVARIVAGCHLMARIVARGRSGESLLPGECHAALHVFAHLGPQGAEVLHRLLAPAQGYDPDDLNRAIHAVGGHPLSCERLRELVACPADTEPCSCPALEHGTWPYRSPVSFAREASPGARAMRPGRMGARESTAERHERVLERMCSSGGDLDHGTETQRVMANLIAARRAIVRDEADERNDADPAAPSADTGSSGDAHDGRTRLRVLPGVVGSHDPELGVPEEETSETPGQVDEQKDRS